MNLLGAEILAAAAIITISELSDGHAPAPKAYIAAWFVYFVLSLVSRIGARAEKFAIAFGGLTLLGVAMQHAGGFVALSGVLTGGRKAS